MVRLAILHEDKQFCEYKVLATWLETTLTTNEIEMTAIIAVHLSFVHLNALRGKFITRSCQRRGSWFYSARRSRRLSASASHSSVVLCGCFAPWGLDPVVPQRIGDALVWERRTKKAITVLARKLAHYTQEAKLLGVKGLLHLVYQNSI